MCDKLVFDLSQEVEGSPSVFVKRDWLNILDNQNANYNSNQSVIDTSQLSNSNKFMSYREAYLSVPLLLTCASTTLATAGGFAPATNATSADNAIGLKNWFGQMIHSLTLDYNGTTIIQQTPWCNMWNTFKLMTSFSWNDVEAQGSTIGFFPDDPTTFEFNTSAGGSAGGVGVCNNTNHYKTPNLTIFSHYNRQCGNKGLRRRQMYINYDADATSGTGTLYSSMLTANACSQVWKSYISSKVDGVNAVSQGSFQISVMATIYLKHLHSFFALCPLLKGAYMKMTLNLNNTSTKFASAGAGGALTLASVSNAVGGVNPGMIASAETDNGSVACFGANDYTYNVSVGGKCLDPTLAGFVGTGGVAQSIYLYVPSYTFNPVFEMSYLSSPVKSIKYTDIYQYQVLNVPAGQNMNNLITNGIADIKSILVVPFYATGDATATQLPAGMPVYQSPFDPAGCGATSPLIQLTNFNIVVSGQNAIYNTQRYSYEEFNNQFYGVNAVNGNMTDGLASGLINRNGFDLEQSFYYLDLSRMLPVEQSVPKSVQIVGQNVGARALDFWVFIEYGVQVDLDILTGVRV
tara:strand:+ start:13392 stop:15119 length:1728 start_codon:yes stop_codon:yes gene_type:complete